MKASPYTLEQDEWLKTNYPKNSIAITLNKFNKLFNTNHSYQSLKVHCNRDLKLKTNRRFNEQEIEWLKENYSLNNVKVTTKKFNKLFNRNKTCNDISAFCNAKLKLVTRDVYTREQDEWLKSFYPYHSLSKTTKEFNKVFNENKGERAILSHSYKGLGLKRDMFYWSKEEVKWLKENYPKYESGEETYKGFCKKFGNTKTKTGMINKCFLLGIAKRTWLKEEIEWLLAHYKDDKPLKETYNEFCKKFPNRKTYASFQTYGKGLGLGMKGRGCYKKGNINYKQEMKNKLNIPKEMVLSDLGNGEYLPMDRKIYKKLSREKGNLKNGDVTKTLYDIEIVKKELKKIEVE